MTCGNKCWEICEKMPNRAACYKPESEYLTCHTDCMAKHYDPEPIATSSSCSEKYSAPEFANGCAECEKWHPGKADECMNCGNKCWHICEKMSSRAACYVPGSEYLTCHTGCMTNKEVAEPLVDPRAVAN